MAYTTDFRSIRAEVGDAEWQARVDLAACYRLMDRFGMSDLIYNHITARIPGTPDHLLINLYGLLYREITASSLVKIGLDGDILWQPETDYGINKSGYVIHGAIHRARPDVACVIHTHTRAGMAVSAMKEGLLPLTQTAMRFVGHLGYHDYEGPAIDEDERARLVRDLGAARCDDPALARAFDVRRRHSAGLQHDVSARTVVPQPGRCDGRTRRPHRALRQRAAPHRASLSAGDAAPLWRARMAGDAPVAGGRGEELRLPALRLLRSPATGFRASPAFRHGARRARRRSH